jgi:hypothetical protein
MTTEIARSQYQTKNEQIGLVNQKNKYLGMLVVTNNA